MADSGAQFLQRRLQRAQRVPPEQRSPEVAAFVESEALLAEVRQLLPLTQRGTPALPLNNAAKQKANQALLLAARACYISPSDPATLATSMQQHLNANVRPDRGPPLFNAQQREDLLASVLLMACTPGSVCSSMQDFTRFCAAAAMLAEPANQAALRRQLQRVTDSLQRSSGAGEPVLLTLQQLQCLLCIQVLEAAGHLANTPELSLPLIQSGQIAAVKEQAARHSARLLQLEPDSPRSQMVAAPVANIGTMSLAVPDVRMLLRAFQLAREQGSDLQAARAGYGALVAATLDVQLQLDAATLRAVLAAYEEAPGALQRCKHLLPKRWVVSLETGLGNSSCLTETVRAALAYKQAAAVATTPDAVQRANAALAHVRRMLFQAVLTPLPPTDLLLCAGCNQQAVGLRRCARCQKVAYCSRACQTAHWPQHKRDCRPA